MENLLHQIAFCGWRVAATLLLAMPAAAEFSHRIHLAEKLECVACHTAAPSSKASADNLLPRPEVCVSCHAGMKAEIKAPRKLTVSKFNHQLHVKMGPAIPSMVAKAIEGKRYFGPREAASRQRKAHACTSCHTGLEISDAVSQAVFPHMGDCLVCHNQIDPPFSCAKCHNESPSLKPATHTSDWVDLHSARALSKTSCSDCHGRGFTCLGCH